MNTLARRASLLVALFAFASTGMAADGKGDKEAWDLVDQAIKAAGGAEALTSLPAQTWTESGNYHGGGGAQSYTADYAQVPPTRLKMAVAGVFAIVLDGDKGWMKMGGETTEMTAEQLAHQQAELRAGYIASLAALAGDRANYTAKLVDGVDVAKRPTLGVSIETADAPKVTLYLDKETKLLAKFVHQVFSPELGKEVEQEISLSEYRDVQGLKIATKFVVRRDGAVYVEGEMRDIKRQKSLPDSAFAKP